MKRKGVGFEKGKIAIAKMNSTKSKGHYKTGKLNPTPEKSRVSELMRAISDRLKVSGSEVSLP